MLIDLPHSQRKCFRPANSPGEAVVKPDACCQYLHPSSEGSKKTHGRELTAKAIKDNASSYPRLGSQKKADSSHPHAATTCLRLARLVLAVLGVMESSVFFGRKLCCVQ